MKDPGDDRTGTGSFYEPGCLATAEVSSRTVTQFTLFLDGKDRQIPLVLVFLIGG